MSENKDSGNKAKAAFELKPSGDSRASVLLVHGLTGNPSEVRPLAEHLRGLGYYCYAPCLTGHDQSLEVLKKVKSETWLADAEQGYQHLKENFSPPHIVIGLSFGGLLSLNLAAAHSDQLKAVISLSAPIRFRKLHRSIALRCLAFMPDGILDLLPCVDKKKRSADAFTEKRTAFEEHSVAAGARLVQVRMRVLKNLHRIKIPLLSLYDPEDHHVGEGSDRILKAAYKGPSYSEGFFPGGQHELTLGKRKDEVFACIEEFLEKVLCQEN